MNIYLAVNMHFIFRQNLMEFRDSRIRYLSGLKSFNRGWLPIKLFHNSVLWKFSKFWDIFSINLEPKSIIRNPRSFRYTHVWVWGLEFSLSWPSLDRWLLIFDIQFNKRIDLPKKDVVGKIRNELKNFQLLNFSKN